MKGTRTLYREALKVTVAEVTAAGHALRSSPGIISYSRAWLHGSVPTAHQAPPGQGNETINVTFDDDKDKSSKTVQVQIGTSLLEAAHLNNIDLEGACEGSLACSTCHVIVEDPEMFAKLPEPSDDENDMLDLAYGLTDTSRLGCQIIAEKDLDGLRVRIPGATRNFAVDGHIPKPH
eukprot:jgi/Botrbrau1/2076/Bobra.0047s0038.1